MSQYKIGHRTINEKLFRGKLADLISFDAAFWGKLPPRQISTI